MRSLFPLIISAALALACVAEAAPPGLPTGTSDPGVTNAPSVTPAPTRPPLTPASTPKSATPTPTAASVTPAPTPQPQRTPTASDAPVATPEPTARPKPKPTAEPTPEPDRTAEPTARPTATPKPKPTAEPTPEPAPTAAPTARPNAFSFDLYEEGDFVSEYTEYMCLPAAMQVMINMMRDGPPDNSREYQDHLYALARSFLIEPCVNCETGAQPEGWAAGLNAEGYGPYEMAVLPTMESAIHLAAKRIRLTNKPVGLLVWRGAHSWAMSGFVADRDPRKSDDFTVSGIYMQDVWYPRISSIWGPSDPPGTLVGMDRLDVDFRKYNRPNQEDPDKDGQYVIIVPALAGDGV